MSEETDSHRDASSTEYLDRPFDSETQAELLTLVTDSIESSFAAERYSPDVVFEALSNPGRRYVLTFLLQTSGYVPVSKLVDYVAAKSNAGMTNEGFRRNVTVELTQTHLPSLEESGFIKYNMERQLVMPTELTRLTEPYLRVALLQQQLTETVERE